MITNSIFGGYDDVRGSSCQDHYTITVKKWQNTEKHTHNRKSYLFICYASLLLSN